MPVLDASTRTAPPTQARVGTKSSIAALAFLEGVAQLGTLESLIAWLTGEVAPNGWAVGWTTVWEPDHEPLELRPEVDREALRALLRDARANAVRSLRGLVWTPRDDEWLTEVVGRGHVASRGQGELTVAVPPGRALSELVLALLAADVLARRPLYEARLCVCSVCSRVSFDPVASGRLGCVAHPVRPERPPSDPGATRPAVESARRSQR